MSGLENPRIERDLEVSIVLPTRNRRRFLDDSLSDALRQSDVSLEVIVVDDGSTDRDAVAEVDLLDPRVRIIRHERRQGPASARNTGAAAARGTWLAFLDDDDRWAPAKLRAQLDVAAASEASWAYSGALIIDEHDDVIGGDPPRDPAIIADLRNPVPGGCSNVIARTALMREVGGFDPRLEILADWDLWLRLAAVEMPAVCPDPHVGYRWHPDNMHVREADRLEAELEYLARKQGAARPGDMLPPDMLRWHALALQRGGRRARAARVFVQRWRRTGDSRDLRRALRLVAASLAGRHVRRLVHAVRKPGVSIVAGLGLDPPEWADPRPAPSDGVRPRAKIRRPRAGVLGKRRPAKTGG